MASAERLRPGATLTTYVASTALAIRTALVGHVPLRDCPDGNDCANGILDREYTCVENGEGQDQTGISCTP